MRLVISGFEDGGKIQAIKGFRSTFLGADLAAAKRVMDDVQVLSRAEWDLPARANVGFVLGTLKDHGVTAHVEGHGLPVDQVIVLLRQFSPELSVGALLDVLEASANLFHIGALVIGGEE